MLIFLLYTLCTREINYFDSNLVNISRISIFADHDLPRNNAKIGRRENFPFYGTLPMFIPAHLKNIRTIVLRFTPFNFAFQTDYFAYSELI